MGLCEARVKQQWEKSFHGGLASSGQILGQNSSTFANLKMQVISNVAYIILEESDLGEIGHNFWKEVTKHLNVIRKNEVANFDWFRCLCWLTLFAVEQFFFLWSGPSDTCRSATAPYHDSLDKLSPSKSQPMVINLHQGCLFNWWKGCCEPGEA